MSQIGESRRSTDELNWIERYAEDRRGSAAQSMWQLPGTSIAAQAFLYSTGLQAGTSGWARLLVAIVGLVTALATLQVVAGEGRRLEIFRRYVRRNRDRRQATPLRLRNLLPAALEAAKEEAKTDSGGLFDAPLLWIEGHSFLRKAAGPSAATTWGLVLVLFVVVDAVVLVFAALQLAGAANPLG
jgi:hypothetical protein